jgi:rubrerythrin
VFEELFLKSDDNEQSCINDFLKRIDKIEKNGDDTLNEEEKIMEAMGVTKKELEIRRENESKAITEMNKAGGNKKKEEGVLSTLTGNSS